VPSSSLVVCDVALYKDELKSRVNLPVEVLQLMHSKT
jgi:ribose 5-phosphate isomerase